LLYIKIPHIPAMLAERFNFLYKVLLEKYHFDNFNQVVFAGGTRKIGQLLWRIGDVRIIDGFFVNGTATTVRWFSSVVRTLQSGYLYDYAFAMIIGLLLLLAVFVHQLF
jgi:NADH-quinone oxidoreductase subunit L